MATAPDYPLRVGMDCENECDVFSTVLGPYPECDIAPVVNGPDNSPTGEPAVIDSQHGAIAVSVLHNGRPLQKAPQPLEV